MLLIIIKHSNEDKTFGIVHRLVIELLLSLQIRYIYIRLIFHFLVLFFGDTLHYYSWITTWWMMKTRQLGLFAGHYIASKRMQRTTVWTLRWALYRFKKYAAYNSLNSSLGIISLQNVCSVQQFAHWETTHFRNHA